MKQGNYLWLIAIFATTFACNYTQKIHDGRTAVDRMRYSEAVGLLEKEFNRAKSRVEKGKLALLLGRSYDRMNQSNRSIQWYKTSYDNNGGIDALKGYAYALKKDEQYEEAANAFKDLGIELGSLYEYRREIMACEIADGWKEIKQPNYTVEITAFNTASADYAPALYKDGLVITSDRAFSTGKELYAWTGNEFSDLFTVNLQTQEVTNFHPIINTPDNEGTAAFSKNYEELYFSRCSSPGKYEDAYCKLMVSTWQGDGWSPPQMLPFVEPDVNYANPSLSADGKYLYFTCNHPDGWGGYDLYVSERTTDGWSSPTILPRTINSPGDEKFPFIYSDTLYFSSDYHPGMGGLDVFKSYKMLNGNWSQPFNLLPPINSGADDFGFIVNPNTSRKPGIIESGFFSSSRAEGKGNDDIYRFERRIPPAQPIKPEIPKAVDYKILLDVFVLEKIFEIPNDPNSRVLGRKPIPGASLSESAEGRSNNHQVDENGKITIELTPETNYSFLAKMEGYLSNDGAFTSKGLGRDPNNPVQQFELEIVLDKIYLDKEIRLENIYYDYDEWGIRDDAKPTLNDLSQNLKINPGIRIQLSSHTDCRGNERYNETLSQRRAQSAVDYLIGQGIDPSRLIAKGYGKSLPEINCVCSRCSEDEHQTNRRTTFKIIE